MAVNWPQCARVPSRSCSLTHAELIKRSPKPRRPLRFFRDTKTLIKILRSLPGRSNNKNSLLKLQTRKGAKTDEVIDFFIWHFNIIIGTARILCETGSMQLSGIRPSVRPSVCLSVCLSLCLSVYLSHTSKPASAGLLLWAKPESDIDRLLLGARQRGIRQGANAGSATSSACVGSWTQTCNTDCVPGGE